MNHWTTRSLKKLLLLIGLNLVVIQTTIAADAIDEKDLVEFTNEGMELWHVPGMSVTIVSQDRVLFERGFGKTAIKNGKPVDQNTLFAIASTTKAMVVSGLLMLVDEGKLSLDDAIVKYIPELHFNDPSLTQQLTVRDLLSHRTGLPSTDFWSFFQDMPLDEQIKRLPTIKSAVPARTRFIYQNTMYEIAGLLIERLSGQKWHHFLTERLWQPIGMNDTVGNRLDIGAKRTHVQSYNFLHGKLIQAEWDFPADYADAAGSAWSSIHDMGLWAQFLLRDGVTTSGKRLISEDSIKEMFTPQQLISEKDFYPTSKLTQPSWRAYGLAWFQQNFQGRKIDFHTGSLTGLIALIGLDRANDKAVVILGNRDHAEMRHALLWEVMDLSASDKKLDWNKAVFELYESNDEASEQKWQKLRDKRIKNSKPSLAKMKYVGDYQNNSLGDIKIVRSGRNFTLKTKLVEFKMSHWHLDTFLVEKEDWKMRDFAHFNIGEDGEIKSFELYGETFTRVCTRDQ